LSLEKSKSGSKNSSRFRNINRFGKKSLELSKDSSGYDNFSMNLKKIKSKSIG